MIRLFTTTGLLLCLSIFVYPQSPGDDPFKPYLTGKAPRMVKDLGEEIIDSVKVHRLVFHSRDVSTPAGIVPSQIFAVIVRPVKAGMYPGLLVVHGGGGAAETERSKRWAKLGYVVVSMDLPGIAEPTKITNSTGQWKNYAYGKNRFTADPDITHSTLFDAVLAGVQSLYLLHDQPDVIKNRIGVTGISWGGYMTTMLSGLASPFIRASFSTYGSGFYDTNSTFLKELDKMPPADRATWLTWLDAGRRAKQIAAPFFIAAATNDNWFYPPAVMTTLDAIKAPVNHLFAPNANHSAPVPGGTAEAGKAGWLKMEELYFRYFLKDKGLPLPTITREKMSSLKNNTSSYKVQFFVKSPVKIEKAEVYYTTTDSAWTKRKWVAVAANTLKKGWYEAELPIEVMSKTGYWFASISDNRPVTVSGRMMLVNDGRRQAANGKGQRRGFEERAFSSGF